jgi:dimethylhistidine N-methyltransferase
MQAPRFIQRHAANAAAVREDLIAGLRASPAHISPKYLYDPLGSRLFEAITELPEYYPTRTEAAIFERHARDIAAAAGRGTVLIDLGAGNCAKAAKLFEPLAPPQYVAVDISVDFLRDALTALQQRHPRIDMLGLGEDFSSGLELPPEVGPTRRLFFYPGSSLGNFAPGQARAFLAGLRRQCGRDGALLIGLDMVKEPAVLNAAYDDALGVTAAFNLNMLRHLNRLAGTDFDVGDWRHVAFYNEAMARIEMHLECRSGVEVKWPGGSRRFDAGERIHTENSHKYTRPQIDAMLKAAGFGAPVVWTDERRWFSVCYARAA